jgi:hypothetical protein
MTINIKDYSNTALTQEESEKYLQSISPPKDLICPITLTLFQEPVLALGDGYTYEKQSVLTWFHSQSRSYGHVRSPVTNAYMDASVTTSITTSGSTFRGNTSNSSTNTTLTATEGFHNHPNHTTASHLSSLIPNKIVADMTKHFKEQLGQELCHRVQAFVQSGLLQDNGFRITSLIEMGADLTMRIKTQDNARHYHHNDDDDRIVAGDSAFMACLRMQHLPLCQVFVQHQVPVLSIVNHKGETCIDLLNTILLSSSSSSSWNDSKHPWVEMLKQLKHKAVMEKEETIQLEQQRERFNQRQRQRQEVLAHESRNIANANRHVSSSSMMPLTSMMQNGLGSLEEGYGFYPSLVALQFQASIPPPPATFAQIEYEEKKRLYTILKSTTVMIFLLWILC